ncbi:nucleoid-associated protein [Methylobacterium sp. Leaf118]|uniref:nucleoid-associated protein n=1 Tax=Methylobacterium sp. Leaf118 TaxID=2876562 RepID=UPI001E54D43C|nr:nucleoid-associated protein [Methylobacterium sp. Leaf118]
MPLENLTIRRVCLHEVYKRGDDGNVRTPTYSNGLLALNDKGLSAFQSRVHSAFKRDAKCMEMALRLTDATSIAGRGVAIVDADDEDFVQQSRSFADLLAEAQVSRQIPGGLTVVFDGTVGYPERHFFGIMKAELHEGFMKQNNMQATFVDSLFLSPKTKLYKIGLFIGGEADSPIPVEDWKPTVYDYQLTSSHRDGAAAYFHSAYLGLDVPQNSAQQVKKFFDTTKAYIKSAQIPQSDKVDLYNSLYSYLKTEQAPTVQVGHFADTYLPPALRGTYVDHMRRERVPDAAIAKDLSEVGGSLRMRRLKFPSKIMLSGPPEAINDLVDIEAFDTPDGKHWTRLTIRGAIEAQE